MCIVHYTMILDETHHMRAEGGRRARGRDPGKKKVKQLHAQSLTLIVCKSYKWEQIPSHPWPLHLANCTPRVLCLFFLHRSALRTLCKLFCIHLQQCHVWALYPFFLWGALLSGNPGPSFQRLLSIITTAIVIAIHAIHAHYTLYLFQMLLENHTSCPYWCHQGHSWCWRSIAVLESAP